MEIRCGNVGNGARCVFLNLGQCKVDMSFPMTRNGRGPTNTVDCICHCPDLRSAKLLEQVGNVPIPKLTKSEATLREIAADAALGRTVRRLYELGGEIEVEYATEENMDELRADFESALKAVAGDHLSMPEAALAGEEGKS